MALTTEQIAIVKSTAPIIKEHGKAITTTFYKQLLSSHPELMTYFALRNQQTGAQQAALADAVYAYSAYVDDLAKLSKAVERIAHKHSSLFIKAEHYPIVGEFLVSAFATVLGGALTPEIKDAWVAAYGQLAEIFIKKEQELYDEAGDWQDWRPFLITEKKLEADGLMSFYLEPKDGGVLPTYKPGQYVSIQVPVTELNGLLQSTQFTLSKAPEDDMSHYRITVKRGPNTAVPDVESMAAGKVPRMIANMLHNKFSVGDEIKLSPPRGEFVLDLSSPSAANSPVVLLSAGIGVTPVMSMLDAILQSPNPRRPISWIQSARNSNSMAFREHIRQVTAQNDNLQAVLFVKNLKDGDRKGHEYDFEGRMKLDALDGDATLHLSNDSTLYYLCGPEEWMMQTKTWLVGKGVSADRVHLELFRTGDA